MCVCVCVCVCVCTCVRVCVCMFFYIRTQYKPTQNNTYIHITKCKRTYIYNYTLTCIPYDTYMSTCCSLVGYEYRIRLKDKHAFTIYALIKCC